MFHFLEGGGGGLICSFQEGKALLFIFWRGWLRTILEEYHDPLKCKC